jgi:chemotaxis protein histidine kinase CheA
MTQILTLNAVAAAILEGMTRLRVNKKTRAGVWYTALRPSHRVAGRNPMIRVEPIENSTSVTAELTQEIAAMVEGLPELKNNHTYVMFDIGYGWWTLREPEDANDQTKPLITVTKGRKSKAAPSAAVADTNADAAPTGDTAEVKAAETPAESKPAEVVAEAAKIETPAEIIDAGQPAADETKPTVTATIADAAPSADAIAAAAASVTDKPGESIEALVAANLASAEGSGDAAPAAAPETPAASSGNSAKAKTASRKGAAKKEAKADETKSVKGADGIVTHVIGG